MQPPSLSAFHFEKTRLIDRKSAIELWEASIQGKRFIVKVFLSPKAAVWSDFEEQSRLHNSIYLRPVLAGYTRKGNFCHALAADFQPQQITTDTDITAFLIRFLALVTVLESRAILPRWDPDHLVRDPVTEKIFLAGFNSFRAAPKNHSALQTIVNLSKLAKSHQCAPPVSALLKKWQRRKELDLSSCFREILNEYPYALELMASSFEWIHSKELEVAGGLFQLASRNRGRAVVLAGDRGEGKSTMLHQLYRYLVRREASVHYVAAQKEERPLQSFRVFLDSFFENISAYTLYKQDLHPQRLFRLLEKSTEASREEFVTRFVRLLGRLAQRKNTVFVFCVDDVHLFDSASLRLLSSLFARIDTLPFLFLMTSCGEIPEFSQSMLTLTLQPGSAPDFERSHTVPLWKNEQRQFYVDQIFARTAGNPLLFGEYFHQTLRQRQSQLVWDDVSWEFQQPDIPAFPNVLLDFYLQQIPPISAQELAFLELASVQGESFDPVLCELDPAIRRTILQSLSEKAVLYSFNGAVRFRKPLLSEALHQRIEPKRRARLHAEIASELLKQNSSEHASVIAHHYLKAGEYSQALSFASAAAEESPAGTNPLFPIFEELDRLSDQLSAQQQLQLFLSRGSLFFRRGNYSAAIENYGKALALQSDPVIRFRTAIQIAQSHVQNNDIFSAQKILQEQAANLSAISDTRMLLDFYLARAYCSWHRGERSGDDFQKAIDIAETLQDYDALAKGFRQQAELKLKEGAMNEARVLAEKALKHSRKRANIEETGQCLRILGSIAWRQSKYKPAEQMLRKSLRLLQKVENQEGTARAWSVLGNIYSERYEFRKSIEAFQNAARLFSQGRHPYETSLAHFNLGLVYVEQGNLKEAERIFLRCRLADKQTGNKRFLAYDLRALAVVYFLRGFYKKAARLFRRTLEICTELNAGDDVLQTRLLLLYNELEQDNYRQAAPLVACLEEQVRLQEDEKALSDMHYLLAHYYGFINDSKKAAQHLEQAEQISRSIRYFKLMGQALILRLILQNKIPARGDKNLKHAIGYFLRSRNELEFYNSMLKLYHAYPSLAKLPEHNRRLMRMEKAYRKIKNRPKFRLVRQVMRTTHGRVKPKDGQYEWASDVLQILRTKDPFSERLPQVLSRLVAEFRASRGVVRYLDGSGVFEKISAPEFSNIVEDLEEKIFAIIIARRQAIMMSTANNTDLNSHPWIILSDVTSLLACPVISGSQVTGCWYFERHGDQEPFSKQEENKLSFFLMASLPALEQALNEETAKKSRATLPVAHSYGDLIGESKPMRELYKQIAKAAPVDISVLIQGESGTGKELVARNLHRNSNRSREAFLALNCSALPETLIESELFGYNKGAFTGAAANKIGLIERANGGTLFLDEIGDLSPAAQAKLLRVMQEREIQRLGDTSVRKINVRFLFATHKDLKRLVKEGSYREDLFYRISVYTLNVPSLRERKEDIPLLLRYFTGKYCQSFGKGVITFTAAAIRTFCEYAWPGNVRELENVVQMLLVNANAGAAIDAEDLPSHLTANEGLLKFQGKSLDEARKDFEKTFLLSVLQNNNWNKTHAAKELKLTRQGLVNLINRLQISEADD